MDNLGQTFVAGFAGKYATLSRTAALSRQLSIFFKYYIRSILKNGEYHIDGEKKLTERNATIVYSGGDDVFIVGAWNEVIELSIDLQEKFKKYTQGTLSISVSYTHLDVYKRQGYLQQWLLCSTISGRQ